MTLPPLSNRPFGEIVEAGGRLMLRCASCGRLRYMRQTFPADARPAEIARTLACHRCLSRDVAVVVVPPPAPGGRWPAEEG